MNRKVALIWLAFAAVILFLGFTLGDLGWLLK